MAQMTFLQLAQRTREKCGISGVGPSTCQNQTAELLRVINWVNEAWTDVQELHENWEWMRAPVSFTTSASKATYAPSATVGETGITDFGNWKHNSFRSYITAAGFATEVPLAYMPYAAWRDYYQFGNLRLTYSRPVQYITVTPNKSLGLGMVPDSSAYTIVGEYYRMPSVLSLDTDIPSMPAKFHMMIVYRAMMKYAAYESAPEVHDEGKSQYDVLISKLEIDQLPDILMAGALC